MKWEFCRLFLSPDIILWFFHRVAIIQIKSVLQLTGNDSNCVIICSSASLWTDCRTAPLEQYVMVYKYLMPYFQNMFWIFHTTMYWYKSWVIHWPGFILNLSFWPVLHSYRHHLIIYCTSNMHMELDIVALVITFGARYLVCRFLTKNILMYVQLCYLKKIY